MLRIILKLSIIHFFAVQKLILANIGQLHKSALTKWSTGGPKRNFALTRNFTVNVPVVNGPWTVGDGLNREEFRKSTYCSKMVKNQLFCCPKAVSCSCNNSVWLSTCTMTMPCVKTAFVKSVDFMLRIVLKWPIIPFFAVQKLVLAEMAVLFNILHAEWPCGVSKWHWQFSPRSSTALG